MFDGILIVLQPLNFFWLVVGVGSGIVVGAIPGLSGAMLIALTLPMTYYMGNIEAIILLIGMYVGSITGGLITAILFSIPGTPSSIVSTFDGYPMTLSGKAGRALGLGVLSSFVGGVISWAFLAALFGPMTSIALRFSSFDYFAMVLIGLALISTVSRGSTIKGLIGAGLGMLAAMPGIDPTSGQLRFQFGSSDMLNGFATLPTLVGVFAVAIVLEAIFRNDHAISSNANWSQKVEISFHDLARHWKNLLRSSVVGTWIGVLPGLGGNVGSIIAYAFARNSSKTPEKFGKGCEDGIVASEAANNATVGGALVPLVAMGIPGSVIDAILIGALMIHNLSPGPLLYRNAPDVIDALIASALLGHVVMLFIMWFGTRYIARLVSVPRHYLFPVILVFCVVGVFSSSNIAFDLWVMLGFAVVGLFFSATGVPLGPFVIGYILAPIAETNLRSGLMATGGAITPMFTHPLTLGLLSVSVVVLLWPFVSNVRQVRRAEERP